MTINLKNTSTCVKLNVKSVCSETAVLLADSGADCCILKVNCCKDDMLIDTSKALSLQGISENATTTLGQCLVDIVINDNIVTHLFQVVKSDFPIPYDGILGRDFLNRFQCAIDFKKKNISSYVNSKLCIWPFFYVDDSLTVPARAEAVHRIKVPNSRNGNLYFCENKEIMKGLYVANSILKSDNGYVYASLVNTNDNDLQIEKVNLNLEPLENFNIFPVNSMNSDRLESNNLNRLNTLINNINSDHMSSDERQSIIDLCVEFNDLFYLKGDKLSYSNSATHKIKTTDDEPINIKPYRIPHHQKQEVQKQVENMLNEKIIFPSKSPWNFPLIVVPKKPDADGNKRYRIAIDFRALNKKTIPDVFPLPNISDILENLGKSKVFSTLDLANGFHQLLIDPKDRDKCSFSTPFGKYSFARMPFGLSNAPATFQRLMNTVLSGLQGIKCFVYMDDIVIYGKNLQDHNNKLKEVFIKLREHNLKLQPIKCNFLRKELIYLGHIINENGIFPDPEKIKDVQKFPIPKTPKNIKQFLGLCGYYRRFIKNFSQIASPLNNLLKKNVEFIWSPSCNKAFEELKSKLINPPILTYPDFSQPFLLTTDASQNAIGAVLSQGDIGKDHPICFGSRTLSKSEKNYSTTMKECLSIVHFCKVFRPYLYGKRFKIITDHKPLQFLFNSKDPNSMLVRWRLQLEEFDYEIIYKKGNSIPHADALSRIHKMTLRSDLKKNQEPENKLTYSNFTEILKNEDISNKNIITIQEDMLNADKEFLFCIFIDKHITNENSFIKNLSKDSKTLLSKIRNKIVNVGDKIHYNLYGRKLLFVATHELEKPSHEDIFNIFVLLKQYLIDNKVNKICFSNFNNEDMYKHLDCQTIYSMLRFIFQNSNILINIYNSNLNSTLSQDEIKQILYENHDSPTGGHKGIKKTLEKIKQSYYWPTMRQDIEDYIKSCQKCQINKSSKITKQPMMITTTASEPFQKVSLDICGPFPLSESNNKYILTFMDDLTKFSEAIPIPNQEAATIAKHFVTQIICRHGCPQVLLTDQGKNFIGQVFKETCKILKIKKIQTSPHHPEANFIERSHRNISEYFRSYANKSQTDWDSWIPFAMFTYNSTIHSATKYTPHELLYGYKAKMPSSLQNNSLINFNYDTLANEIKSRFKYSHQLAKENIQKNKQISKQYYDKNTKETELKVGDLVLLKDNNTYKGKCKKLLPVWKGPYEIMDLPSPVNCTIMVNGKNIIVHRNKLKPFIE